MSEKGRLIKNTGLIAIGNFGAKMISFILLPLYTSILTTSEYGTYDYIVAISAFLLPVTTLAMHEAMFRFIIDEGNKGQKFKKIVTNALLTVIIGCAVLGVILAILEGFCKINNCIYIWLYVSASALYTFSNNMLRGLGRMKEYAIFSSAKNILQLVLNVLVVAVFRWGMEGLLFSLCVSEIVSFLVVILIVNIWKYLDLGLFSLPYIKVMLKYSLPLIPNALSAQIINLSDRLVISGFMGTSANGIYSVSYKFPNMIETVYHYFYTAWSESASRVFAKGKEEATKYYQSLYDTINSFMFSVIILMVAGMPILFRIFVRGDYIEGFKYIWMLMFAMYFDSLAKFYSGLFTAVKKTNVMAVSTIIAAIINITVNLVLIQKIGLYAAAGSTLVADIVLVLIRKRGISKEINLKLSYKRIILELCVAFIIVFLNCYDNWIKIGLSILIAAIYAIVMNKAIIVSIFKIAKKNLAR